jgi:hypothetical protein
MKQQLEEGVPDKTGQGFWPATQSTRDSAAQMPTTPSTLRAMSQMEYDRQANSMFGSGNFRDAGNAASQENDLRVGSPASSSMNMLPARAAQRRQEEQLRQFLQGNQ